MSRPFESMTSVVDVRALSQVFELIMHSYGNRPYSLHEGWIRRGCGWKSITTNGAPQKWSRTWRFYPLPTCSAMFLGMPHKSAVPSHQFNFLWRVPGVVGGGCYHVLLDGEMSMEWSRRSRPPRPQCNWLCSDHFHHSQWVIWHVLNGSTLIYCEESSILCLLEDKNMNTKRILEKCIKNP